jgi:hypothetical protein
MIVRVIYRDQTVGVVEKGLLDDLIKMGRVAAYNCADKWIPIESKGCCVYAGMIERNDDIKMKSRQRRSH